MLLLCKSKSVLKRLVSNFIVSVFLFLFLFFVLLSFKQRLFLSYKDFRQHLFTVNRLGTGGLHHHFSLCQRKMEEMLCAIFSDLLLGKLGWDCNCNQGHHTAFENQIRQETRS